MFFFIFSFFFIFFICQPNEKLAEVLVGSQPRSLISLRNPYQILDFLKDSLLNCCQALSALGNHEQICGFLRESLLCIVFEVRYYGNVCFPEENNMFLKELYNILKENKGLAKEIKDLVRNP